MLYKDVLNTISYQSETSVRFDIELPMIIAELKYAISKEWVKNIDDFLLRRTYYGYMHYDKPDFLRAVATQFKQMTNSNQSEESLLSKVVERLGFMAKISNALDKQGGGILLCGDSGGAFESITRYPYFAWNDGAFGNVPQLGQ